MGKASSTMITQNPFDKDYRHLTCCTPFDENKLRHMYNQFMRDFPSGTMTKKMFLCQYETWKKEVKGGDAKQFASHLFRTFDTDGSGEIDK